MSGSSERLSYFCETQKVIKTVVKSKGRSDKCPSKHFQQSTDFFKADRLLKLYPHITLNGRSTTQKGKGQEIFLSCDKGCLKQYKGHTLSFSNEFLDCFKVFFFYSQGEVYESQRHAIQYIKQRPFSGKYLDDMKRETLLFATFQCENREATFKMTKRGFGNRLS